MQWSASQDASASVRSGAPLADHTLFQSHSFTRPAMAARAYATTQIVAAPMLPLTIDAHAAATRLLQDARRQQEAGEAQAAQDTLRRTRAHLDLMRRCVLLERGGMAPDLARIYDYLSSGLKQAISSGDDGRVEIALQTMQSLTAAWEQRSGSRGGPPGAEPRAYSA